MISWTRLLRFGHDLLPAKIEPATPPFCDTLLLFDRFATAAQEAHATNRDIELSQLEH
jgi:hypothetical protein